jgi:hypothetical protein
MVRLLLIAALLFAGPLEASAGQAGVKPRPAAAPALSISQLIASPVVYDRGPIAIHARLANVSPHAPLLVDEACRGGCDYVIGFDIPDAIAQRPDIRMLTDVRVENDHSCFVKLLVKVTYKWARPDMPRPPAGLRVRRLEIVKVLGVSARPPVGRAPARPCPTLQ